MHGRWLRALSVALPLLAWTASSGCGPTLVDLDATLELVDVGSGWSQEAKGGQTRIVPTVSFRLAKRAPDTPLDRVSLNITFLRQPGDEQFDDIYLQRVAIGPEGSEPLTVRADTGYTGEAPQTGADMLQHADFRDMSVRILARQSSGSWVELYTGPIERHLLLAR
jgi:hypothetical protein